MTRSDKKIFSVLFFSIFTAVLGVGIVVPLLPVYAHDMGANGVYIGFIFGAFSLSRSFLLPFFGRRSDTHGRKPFIVFGLLGYALISVAFIFAHSVNMLILIRFIQGGVSAMMMPVLQAYVADITPRGHEGFVMGVFNMSMFIGLSGGPVIGGVISDYFSLQTAFLCMGALSFFGFLLSVTLLPATRDEQVMARQNPPARWRVILADRVLAGLFFFRFAYVFCVGIIWGFLPVYADVRFGLSATQIGVLVMLGVLVSGMLNIPMGWAADRMNKRMMVISGGMVVMVAILLFLWARGYWDMFAISVLFGIGGGLCMPAIMAIAVLAGHRSDAMGSVMSIITVAHSVGMLAGAMLGGVMMDMFALRHAFPLGAVVMGGGVLFFWISSRMIALR